ncbi:ankyrin repeat domain-containing protein [Sphingobacterium corticibacterium]|uniref:Ankyrin repeat domain-containing protein n=1 Tax=Sphingobacterium corticibacterium TaxID=2484746 RepID=A0A4Q6XDE1_9SPHI|nr:ankyrin repeat domain-containing protein [Sphingobacterium corticibacterium]RZF57439.1 ankyrin repeat domain-containing protein [Sphingobacterium corticibacterium]
MKRLLTAALLLAALHAGAQENILLNKEFWAGKPDVNTVKAELAKGFDFKEITSTADPILLAINNDAPIEVIKYLIDQPGVDLKRTLMEGRIYLHVAAQKNNAPVVDYLLTKGSDMNFLDANHHTALSFAAFNTHLSPAVIDVFVKHGLDIQQKYTEKDGANLSMLAVGYDKDLSTTDYLISKGLSINSTDNSGNTIFNHAAKIGNLDVLKGLLKRGAKYTPAALFSAAGGTYRSANKLEVYQYLVDDLNIDPLITDKNGRNVLHLVVRKQNQGDVIDYFFKKGVDINKTDAEGNTPFIGAAGVKNVELIGRILPTVKNINAVNSNGESALTNAVKSSNAEVVALLLKNGADVNVIDKDGQNLAYLLIDAYRGAGGRGSRQNATAQTAPADELGAKLHVLKENGLNLASPFNDGSTLYHVAITKNDLALMKKISYFGIDINVKNEEELTVLHKAAMLAKDDTILRYLLSAGAKKDIGTSFGETAYDLAYENELLKQANISIDFLK